MSDNKKIKEVIEQLREYDIYDLLAKIASLNLFPENQNKCLIFDYVINSLLCEDPKNFQEANKIGSHKFKKMIDKCFDFDIAKAIDPIGNPFIQRVQFYGNRWIFSGINDSIAFNLQNLLDILFKANNDFNAEFLDEARLFFEMILMLSSKIVQNLGYSIETLKSYGQYDFFCPNNQRLCEASCALTFKVVDIERLIGSDLLKDLEISFGDENKSHSVSGNSYKFFYKPFLRVSFDKIIILNPTMLAPFSIYYVVKLAEKYNEKDKLIRYYNDKVWFECLKSLKKLGHLKIKETDLGFELLNSDTYKERLLSVANDGVLFVRFFCDDGNDYKEEGMFDFKGIKAKGLERRDTELVSKVPSAVQKRVYQLILLNGFGRTLGMFLDNSDKIGSVALTPFQLQCIAINEHKHELFIPRYIESKSYMSGLVVEQMADFEYLTQYADNNYTFYLDDDIDVRKTLLMPDYTSPVIYINRALKTEDRHLIEYPNSESLKEIVFYDDKRNIYADVSCLKYMNLVNRFKNLDIWVVCDEPKKEYDLNLNMSLLDLITYWLAENKNIIETATFTVSSIIIKNNIVGEAKDFIFVSGDGGDSEDVSLDIQKTGPNIMEINWTQKAYQTLVSKGQSKEKDFIRIILDKLSFFTFENQVLEIDCSIFGNALKTKVFPLEYGRHPYFKPIEGKVCKISKECISRLLDEIGDYLLTVEKLGYGIIGSDNSIVCKKIVDFLYKKLKEVVNQFNSKGFVDVIYRDLEIIMYQMMMYQKRFAYEIACYPERAEESENNYNDLNVSSTALKFLLEYISAKPPQGKQPLGIMDYEYLLAICSLIVEWAHNSDLFYYRMVDTKLEMLKSGRIGFSRDNVQDLAQSNLRAARFKLNALSNPYVDIFINHELTIEKLDDAFKAEYGYTFTQFYSCGIALIGIGDRMASEIKCSVRDEITMDVSKTLSIDTLVVKKIIDDISLSQRKNYLKPEEPFTPEDVYPWRFNRRLSFNRRPLIIDGDNIVWGNRNLYHCLMFTLDLIEDGKFKAQSAEMKKYVGEIANRRGDNFNKKVFEKVCLIDGLIVRQKVKKINGVKIMDDKNQNLGDIDVLIINPKKKKIVVVETKDFSFSKTPYEMNQQYRSVFCDDKKLCYISKHKKRVDWVNEHIEDVKLEYGLQPGIWKVKEVLITSEPIVSNDFYHKNQNILLYSEINKESIYGL